MTNAAWFHCFSGIAGDMALGSLIDAGADVEGVRTTLDGLNLPGWTLDVEVTQRAGVRATRAIVEADEDDHVVRTYRTIRKLLTDADLPKRVRDRSLAVFDALATVEGKMHGQDPDEVHFHEVGGIDAIVDITGTCAALELLEIDHVYASSVATGSGYVRSSHGMLPNPAPAVIGLLDGAPVHGLDRTLELTTPTGAAILAALCEHYGPMPAFARLTSSGFGAGSRDLSGMPNCTQVVVGRLAGSSRAAHGGQPVVKLEVNVDDVTGEVLAHTVTRLLESGAHDAWITPMIMKKGRPAYTVSALADGAKADGIAEVMVTETGSFGVRGHTVERWPARRVTTEVDVDGEPVGLKSAAHRTKAEFDDAARAASSLGRPVRDVIAEAEREGHHHHHDFDEPPHDH